MTALRYVGDGAYIHGVPARDLTDEEAATFGALIREQEQAAHITLYEPVAQPTAVSKRTAKADAEGGDNG
jgi:hypothetical protein